jgi:hypothetical protein
LFSRQEQPGFEESAQDKAALGREREMMEPFPDKPKGMHHDIYTRLFLEHHEAEMEHLVGVREWLYKLEKQIA